MTILLSGGGEVRWFGPRPWDPEAARGPTNPQNLFGGVHYIVHTIVDPCAAYPLLKTS